MDGTLKLPFEAVSIRYVHDVRAEEFLNIGIVLLSRTHTFSGARFLPQWGRVSAAFPGADLVLLRRVARAFQERCAEWTADVHRLLPFDHPTEVKAFVHSVMLPDDASIQFSPVIGGVTTDAERTLRELFHVYVSASLQTDERTSRDDSEVWKEFAALRGLDSPLLRRLQRHTIRSAHYDLEFDNAWKNGTWNVAQPISFDHRDPRYIKDKAIAWTGKLLTVRPLQSETNVYLLVGMPRSDQRLLREAAQDGIAILKEGIGKQARVLPEDEGEFLAQKIAEDLSAHDE